MLASESWDHLLCSTHGDLYIFSCISLYRSPRVTAGRFIYVCHPFRLDRSPIFTNAFCLSYLRIMDIVDIFSSISLYRFTNFLMQSVSVHHESWLDASAIHSDLIGVAFFIPEDISPACIGNMRFRAVSPSGIRPPPEYMQMPNLASVLRRLRIRRQERVTVKMSVGLGWFL